MTPEESNELTVQYVELLPGDEIVALGRSHYEIRVRRRVEQPSLPTEPYTVIRVTWDEHHADWIPVLVLGQQYEWAWSAEGLAIDVHDLPKWITGVEVLSEPRAVTAKAVLGRLLSRLEAEGIKVTNIAEWIDMTGRDFGVVS